MLKKLIPCEFLQAKRLHISQVSTHSAYFVSVSPLYIRSYNMLLNSQFYSEALLQNQINNDSFDVFRFARVQDNDTDEEGEPSHSSKPSSSTKPATVVSSSSCKDTPDESKDSNVPASSSTVSLFDTSSEDPPVVERSSSPAEAADKNDETSSSSNKVNVEGEEVPAAKTDEPVEDEVEDDDDEEEDEEDEMLIKENVKPDTFDDIDISDDEELIVPTS